MFGVTIKRTPAPWGRSPQERHEGAKNRFDILPTSCYTHRHINHKLTTMNGKSTHQGVAQRADGVV
jgi:hypothetical protein